MDIKHHVYKMLWDTGRQHRVYTSPAKHKQNTEEHKQNTVRHRQTDRRQRSRKDPRCGDWHGSEALGGHLHQQLGGWAGHPQLEDVVEGAGHVHGAPIRVLAADLTQQCQRPLKREKQLVSVNHHWQRKKQCQPTTTDRVETVSVNHHWQRKKQCQSTTTNRVKTMSVNHH